MSKYSFSKISTYQRCPAKYDFMYNQKMRRSDERYKENRYLGSLVHEGIAGALIASFYHSELQDFSSDVYHAIRNYHYFNRPSSAVNLMPVVDDNSDLVFEEMIDEDFEDQLEATVELAINIATRTIEQLGLNTEYKVVGVWGEPAVELELAYDLNEMGSQFVGRLDAVLQDIKTGLIYIVDWKVRSSFSPDEFDSDIVPDDFNMQISLYREVFYRQYGITADGTIVYQIAPKVPSSPKINKDGTISRRRIKTDWDTYQKTVIEHGLDPADYMDVYEWASKTEFWKPITIFPQLEEGTLRLNTFKEWVNMIENNSIYPKHENPSCMGCPFATICLWQDRGFDVEALFEADFIISEDEYEDG